MKKGVNNMVIKVYVYYAYTLSCSWFPCMGRSVSYSITNLLVWM